MTKYQDEWTSYNVHCPIYSGSYTIGKDIAIIENNSLKNPSIEHVNHYAKLLAHTDVTLMRLLVEARDSGGVPIAKNEPAKQSIIDYQKKVYVGKVATIMDLAGVGVEYMGADRHTQLKITEVWDTRTKLLKQFYADIGVRATFDKRSNAVVDEITSDSSMLLYNVSDTLRIGKYDIPNIIKCINNGSLTRIPCIIFNMGKDIMGEFYQEFMLNYKEDIVYNKTIIAGLQYIKKMLSI